MGKKQILIFQYDCMVDNKTMKEFSEHIHNTLDKYGYAVADSRVSFKTFEIDGTDWENKDGSL